MEKKLVCETCGKEFTEKELKPIRVPLDSRTLGKELIFCSKTCEADYEHGQKKDW